MPCPAEVCSQPSSPLEDFLCCTTPALQAQGRPEQSYNRALRGRCETARRQTAWHCTALHCTARQSSLPPGKILALLSLSHLGQVQSKPLVAVPCHSSAFQVDPRLHGTSLCFATVAILQGGPDDPYSDANDNTAARAFLLNNNSCGPDSAMVASALTLARAPGSGVLLPEEWRALAVDTGNLIQATAVNPMLRTPEQDASLQNRQAQVLAWLQGRLPGWQPGEHTNLEDLLRVLDLHTIHLTDTDLMERDPLLGPSKDVFEMQRCATPSLYDLPSRVLPKCLALAFRCASVVAAYCPDCTWCSLAWGRLVQAPVGLPCMPTCGLQPGQPGNKSNTPHVAPDPLALVQAARRRTTGCAWGAG